MDPNATFAIISDTLEDIEDGRADSDAGRVLDEACLDLWCWLKNGGFEPAGFASGRSADDLAVSYYNTRAVGHDRGENLDPDTWDY